MRPVFIIAEIGINHNGNINLAKKLIDLAVLAGCDAVKFQKRTVDKVYTAEFLESYRESPWGTTQRQQKEGLEFGNAQYDEIDSYCKHKGIEWFASAWDVDSQEFLENYDLKYNKVASAMLTNIELIERIAREKKYTFISTGMSTFEEIETTVGIFNKFDCPYEIMHCNSTYPMADEDANLLMIPELQKRYKCNVGFSSHETGMLSSIAAVAMGATSIERHITLDKAMYGSDQAVSLEPSELLGLVKSIRILEKALGNGERIMSDKEMAVRKKLRG